MLRLADGLSIQDLADRSEIHSKGHLSNVERGLVRPNVQTLKQIAEGLGVLPLDLLTFPTDDPRQRLVDLTREMPARRVSEILRTLKKGARKAAIRKARAA